MKHNYLENFRYNLKLLRCSWELSAEQLNGKLGMSGKRISNLECAQTPPTMEDVFAIKNFFNISFNQLFDERIKLNLQHGNESGTAEC